MKEAAVALALVAAVAAGFARIAHPPAHHPAPPAAAPPVARPVDPISFLYQRSAVWFDEHERTPRHG